MTITASSVIRRTDEMMEDIAGSLNNIITRYLDSGALDLEVWGEDYRLSKVLLSEALKELGERYDLRTHKHFFTEEQLDQIENIKYF